MVNPSTWNLSKETLKQLRSEEGFFEWLSDNLTTELEERITNIELELATTTLVKYKEFTYTGDDLTKQEIWDSSLMVTKYFTLDYTYSLGNLTNLQVTRESDSFVYNKVFTYDIDNNLTSINITI